MCASIKCSESQDNVSHDIGMPESTIHGWLTDKEKLCDFADTVDSIDQMKRRGQNCQRLTNSQRSFHVVCEDAGRNPG